MAERSCRFVATATLLFFIANVISTSALKGGYEQVHVYNYAAKINVGVYGHVSEYYIDGHLKIQRDPASDMYVMSLSDLKHNYYYGEEDSARVSQSNPIDDNVLQAPFYVAYDEDGQYKYTTHTTVEPEWSRNIKKSIASLFQFNSSTIQRGLSSNGKLDERIKLGKEATVHGKCKVDYIITKMNQLAKFSEKLLLIRAYSLRTCDDFTDDINGYLTNYKVTKKAVEDTTKWGLSSVRNAYQLEITNGVPTIKRITNFESYSYDDNIDNVVFIKDNRPLLVNIRQNLVFNSTSLDDSFLKDAETDVREYEKNKTTWSDEENSDVHETEGTGRELVQKITNLMLESYKYMEKSHLEIVDRGTEHRQWFNKILSNLKRLDSHGFSYLEREAIEGTSSDKLRNLLITMLPYVGTKDSLNFTLDLISRKIMSDDSAINLLTTLPVYAPTKEPSLETFVSFAFKNDRDKWQLSPKVYEATVVSFSHLLNKICNRFAGAVSDEAVIAYRQRPDADVIAKEYLPHIVQAFEAAKTTTSKLAFLSALGNVRNDATVKYITPILSRRNDDAKDQDRLRLAAINILSELICEENSVYSQFTTNLTAILRDKSESRSIRLAAYDVIVKLSNYDVDKFHAIGRMISDDTELYNYHLSTIEGLQQAGILNSYANLRLNPSKIAVQPSLSKIVIVKTDKLLKPELLKSTLRLQSAPQTYLKLSILSGDQSVNSDWRVPSLVKFEVLEERDEKIVVVKAVYLHTNFNGKDMDKGVFFDLWAIFNQNTRAYYVDTIEFKNLPNLLELADMILQKMHEKFNFVYEELTSFSLKTGFGIDAVFEHKYPSLTSTFMDYNWNAEENYLEAKVDFSLKGWSNGYSGVSMYNPLSGLTSSIRKTQQLDTALAFSVIVKYDLAKHELNLTIPYSQDPERTQSGLAMYSSTSVGVTDENDEISCENCGFRVAAKYDPPTNLKFRRSDYLGLLVSHMTYNCDPDQSLDAQNLLGNADDGKTYEVNTCGYITTIRPNSSKPISQIELLIKADFENSKSWEKPWYFLPGYKMYFESSIGSRHLVRNEVNNLLKLDFNVSSSQGHFSNLLQFRFVKKNDDDSNLILCYDGKADFPETDDNHLPTEAAQSNLHAFSRFKFGRTERDDSCSAVDFTLDFDLTGEVSEMHRDALENYASQSLCALQKSKWLNVYLREGEDLLTEACVREMISNTTLRRYKLDLTSEKFSDISLLQALLIIRSTQDKLKEMVANSHKADVEIKMISPISEIRTRKQMSFMADYPVPDIYRNLPNIYFSQEFVLAFIDKKINVINVYPGMIVFNNEEKPLPESSDWIEIHTGVEKTPYQIYASVVDDKISFKILYKSYELIMKPKLVESKDSNDLSYVPQIYYNQQLFSDFHKRLHLFSSQEILFSLSRVDDYMMIRSDVIPVTIYYKPSSINIFQKM